jgi:hypothetical protein
VSWSIPGWTFRWKTKRLASRLFKNVCTNLCSNSFVFSLSSLWTLSRCSRLPVTTKSSIGHKNELNKISAAPSLFGNSTWKIGNKFKFSL